MENSKKPNKIVNKKTHFFNLIHRKSTCLRKIKIIRIHLALVRIIKMAEIFLEKHRLIISLFLIFQAIKMIKIIIIHYLVKHSKVTKMSSNKIHRTLFLVALKPIFFKMLTINPNRRKIHLKKQVSLFSLFRIVRIIAKVKLL